jgi:hypothetical protein
MGIMTLLRYLMGGRSAILSLAASPGVLALGMLFVMSAGFARDYDGVDLLQEPGHLLVPAGASLVASLVLFVLAYLCAPRWRQPAPTFFGAYRCFLGLFWMTAPLAWLYAVPYERFLEPVDSMRANLTTLAVVAVWRMALMMRVSVVLLGYAPLKAFFMVMAFGNGMALLALNFSPVPLLDLMSGTRLSESEMVLQSAAQSLGCLAALMAPISFVAVLTLIVSERKQGQTWPLTGMAAPRPSRGLWALALGSIAVWLVILPFTQPEQQLRRRVERILQAGLIHDGITEISAHARDEFPPHWQPPPQKLSPWQVERNPKLLDVCEYIATHPVAPWVREIYVGKLRTCLADRLFGSEDVPQLARILKLLPERPELEEEIKSQNPFLWNLLEAEAKKSNP